MKYPCMPHLLSFHPTNKFHKILYNSCVHICSFTIIYYNLQFEFISLTDKYSIKTTISNALKFVYQLKVNYYYYYYFVISSLSMTFSSSSNTLLGSLILHEHHFIGIIKQQISISNSICFETSRVEKKVEAQ